MKISMAANLWWQWRHVSAAAAIQWPGRKCESGINRQCLMAKAAAKMAAA